MAFAERWIYIDEEDFEFYKLPLDLQVEISNHDAFPEDFMNIRYEPLLFEALKYHYEGVRNEYIAMKLFALTGVEAMVWGTMPELHSCPCCKYKTLPERGEYFICPICYWEDEGTDEKKLDKYSPPNHMTLSEAREAFKQREAIDAKVIDLKLQYYHEG